jgi:hypothetical protein
VSDRVVGVNTRFTRRALGWALALTIVIGPSLHSAASPAAADPWLAARIEAQPVELGSDPDTELSLLVLERPEVDLPVSIRLRSETVELVENRLGWADVVDAKSSQPRFRTRFANPTQPGEHRIDADVAYVVCGDQWCREKRGRLSWTFVVAA